MTDGWFVRDPAPHPKVGITLGVPQPGKPSGMYEAERPGTSTSPSARATGRA